MLFSRRTLLAAPVALGLIESAVRQTIAADRAPWPTKTWASDSPESQGMDSAPLAELDRRLTDEVFDVTGVVIVRHGYVVHERYYGNVYGEGDPVKIRSVTKSVISALVGIAQREDLISGLDQTIGDLIPDRIPSGADPVTPTITIGNLLTMTAGWEWDISTDYQRLIASDDWVEYTLSQPVVYQPGTFYAYNSGGAHLLSVMLEAATGEETADFAQERLFTPLGIARPTWQRSPQGEAGGGFGLELTPRNMAKLGYLFLRRGRWEKEQIVPSQYVKDATAVQSAGDSTGFAAYGYLWWVTVTPGGLPAYFALGFGSQYVYVVPDLDLVVVIAHGFNDTPPIVTPSLPIIESLVLPAIIE